jgi:hypothetical protein
MRDIMQILQQVKEAFVYSLNKAGTLDEWGKALLGYGKYGIQEEVLQRFIRKDFEYIQATKLDESINSDAPMDLNTIQVYNYTGIGGETTFTYGGFIGRHVFNAFKDGIQYVIRTSGVPVGKEVLYDDITGEMTWGIPFEDGEVATILFY